MGDETPGLSVVLSTLGNHALLSRVLDGYARQDAPTGSFEVLVVMDRAEPKPAAVDEAIGSRPYAVRRISGRVPGLSANRNAGRRAARAPVVMFTDNDTIPVTRQVSEHLDWHARHPAEEVGVLGHVRWARELRVTPFMRWLDQGIQFDYPNIRGTDAGPGRFYGANVSVKRRFADRVGDFDEQHLPYGYEDIEWAHRAARLGFRLLYNRRAVVDHVRPMTLEFWKKRVRRLAVAERQLMRMHPDARPGLYRMFEDAMDLPPSRGRGVRLLPYVPRWVPWLGAAVWTSSDRYFKQALAPHFFAAWDEAEAAGREPVQPDLSEFEA